MTYKLTTGILSLLLFCAAFSEVTLDAALFCGLIGFLSGMMFWGRVFTEMADRRDGGGR